MADDQFHTPRSTQRKRSRVVVGWTRDSDDDPIVEDVQIEVRDAMQMVVESKVPYAFEI